MTPPQVLRVFRELGIDCIGKNLFIEKMAFLSMSNICFHEWAIFQEQYFLGQFPGNSFQYNNIVIPMK